MTFALPPVPGGAQMIAQTFANLPLPGTMIEPSTQFVPPLVRGITVHPDNPFEFDFIINTGDENLQGEAFQQESKKLIKYFLAAVTVPDEEFWVNLSPEENDRVVPLALGQTQMGVDMLAQDYLLKQLTASLMYPEKELGREFWKRVYDQAEKEYGTTDIPFDNFHKVWIVPDKAEVYEHNGTAFVTARHLKVMLEVDYLDRIGRIGDSALFSDAQGREVENRALSPILRKIILPAIEYEVNHGKTFAALRQIYNSMILATWYKQTLRESLLSQVYADQNKIAGIDIRDKRSAQKVYAQYMEAFRKGVYNYIKEDVDAAAGEVVPRQYFSGGITRVQNLAVKKGDLSDKDLLAQRQAVMVPESKKGSDQNVTWRAVKSNALFPEESESADFAMLGSVAAWTEVALRGALTRGDEVLTVYQGKLADLSFLDPAVDFIRDVMWRFGIEGRDFGYVGIGAASLGLVWAWLTTTATGCRYRLQNDAFGLKSKRKAAKTLGDLRDVKSIDLLADILLSRPKSISHKTSVFYLDTELKKIAARSLGRIGSYGIDKTIKEKIVHYLTEATLVSDGIDASINVQALRSLVLVRQFSPIIEALACPVVLVRVEAVEILQESMPLYYKNTDEVTEKVLSLFQDPSARVRIAAEKISKEILNVDHPTLQKTYLKAFEQKDAFVRQFAIEGISKLEVDRNTVFEFYRKASKDKNDSVRQFAILGIAGMGGEDAQEFFKDLAKKINDALDENGNEKKGALGEEMEPSTMVLSAIVMGLRILESNGEEVVSLLKKLELNSHTNICIVSSDALAALSGENTQTRLKRHRKIFSDSRKTKSSLEMVPGVETDSALLAAPGGIDFNPAQMNLQIRRDKNGMPLPLPQQPSEIIEIQGLTPVILNVVPANIPLILGLKEEAAQKLVQL